jgi:glyoxylase-like metal-dependent hydrolase (beta-lactamase superfamily II)
LKRRASLPHPISISSSAHFREGGLSRRPGLEYGLRAGRRIALVGGGNFGMCKLLIEQLDKRGLKPAQITDLLLTHSHYDHSVN